MLTRNSFELLFFTDLAVIVDKKLYVIYTLVCGCLYKVQSLSLLYNVTFVKLCFPIRFVLPFLLFYHFIVLRFHVLMCYSRLWWILMCLKYYLPLLKKRNILQKIFLDQRFSEKSSCVLYLYTLWTSAMFFLLGTLVSFVRNFKPHLYGADTWIS